MKPPYQITDKILKLVVAVSEKLGEINATHLYKPPTELRKKNRIKNHSIFFRNRGKYAYRGTNYRFIGEQKSTCATKGHH